MSFRSHLDLCSFISFIHIKNYEIAPNLDDFIKALELRNEMPVAPILNQLSPRSRQVIFHETYHYWQGLRLPFTFRYAFLAIIRVAHGFRVLARECSDYKEWSCFLPELHRLDLKSRIGFDEAKTYWTDSDGESLQQIPNLLYLSCIDLMECATSIAEFQVTTISVDQRTEPSALKRWTKLNPAYIAPFQFAARFLGNEPLALRTIIPMINASFHTTDPIRAFAELLSRFKASLQKGELNEILSQPEPCRWPEYFQMLLDDIQFEAEANSCTNLLGTKYYRLTLDHWVKGGALFKDGHYVFHPYLAPLAQEWIKSSATKPIYLWILDMPGWVHDEALSECMTKFSSPVTAIRFHIPNGHDKFFIYGKTDLSGFTNLHSPQDQKFRGFLVDFMTMYGAVRRASGAHFDETQRTCYHYQCPHYPNNFCNSYPIIPERYEDCGFPKRIDRLIELRR